MSDAALQDIRDLIQVDVNQRGLATDPDANLINAFPDDFAAACRSIAETPDAGLCVITGFTIADADPPAGETDGPLGALFLARALTPLGIRVALATDPFCYAALQAGVNAAGLGPSVPILRLNDDLDMWLFSDLPPLTHLIALERVGPSRAGPCYNMRGRDITSHMAPAHLLFDQERGEGYPALTTIGIGDGGNEIGMGKISPEVIGRNIPNGELIACRVPTDHLIVCGVSNWGAYALAAGVALLRQARLDLSLFDANKERQYLRIMVEQGPLVDGVTARPTVTVDGLSFEEYVKPLIGIRDLLRV
jgi:D-glutamate cyclase